MTNDELASRLYAASSARAQLLAIIGGKLTEIALDGGNLRDLNEWIQANRTALTNGTPIRAPRKSRAKQHPEPQPSLLGVDEGAK